MANEYIAKLITAAPLTETGTADSLIIKGGDSYFTGGVAGHADIKGGLASSGTHGSVRFFTGGTRKADLTAALLTVGVVGSYSSACLKVADPAAPFTIASAPVSTYWASSITLNADGVIQSTTNWSLSCWFRGYTGGQLFSAVDVPQNGPGLLVTPSGQARVQSAFAGGNQSVRTSGISGLNDGNWHHIVWTFDPGAGANNSLRSLIYIDGVLSTGDTFFGGGAGNFNVAFPMTIGNNPNAPTTNAFELDEMAVWSSTLTLAKVQEMYNSGNPTNLNNHSSSANLHIWWRLGDGSDTFTTLIDVKSGVNLTGFSSPAAGNIDTAFPGVSAVSVSQRIAGSGGLYWDLDGGGSLGSADGSLGRPANAYITTLAQVPTLRGGTTSAAPLNLTSTSHGTKGKIFFGAISAFDEANTRLGIGTSSPTEFIQFTSPLNALVKMQLINTAYGVTAVVQTDPSGPSARFQGLGAGRTEFFGTTGVGHYINNSDIFTFTTSEVVVPDDTSLYFIGRVFGGGGSIYRRFSEFHSRRKISMGFKPSGGLLPGGLLHINAQANGAGENLQCTTTANASTTITLSGSTSNVFQYVGVGDYIYLSSNTAVFGKVISYSSPTITVDTPLGNGTTQSVFLMDELAIVKNRLDVITTRFDRDGKIWQAADILSTTDSGFNIGASLANRPTSIYVNTQIEIGPGAGVGAGGKLRLYDGNFGGAEIFWGPMSMMYHGDFRFNPGGNLYTYTVNGTNIHQWPNPSQYNTSDNNGSFGRNLVLNGGFADYYWGRLKEVYAGTRLQVGSPSGLTAAAGASLYSKGTFENSSSWDTTANASTTITSATSGVAFKRNFGIGDYIRLNGLGTVARITAIASDSSMTVSVALGDGVLRTILHTIPPLTIVTGSGLESVHVDYLGRIYMQSNVSNATELWLGNVLVAAGATINFTGVFGQNSRINFQDGGFILSNYGQTKYSGPSGAYIRFDNSTGGYFGGRGLIWDSGDGENGVSGLGYNLGTYGRPSVIYSKNRIGVGNSISFTNPAGSTLSAVASTIVNSIMGGTQTTSANASTTIVVVSAGGIDQHWRYNVGVGDYVFLTGLGTIARVATIVDGTTFTTDVALGDGTSRVINCRPGMLSFRDSTFVEYFHMDYTGTKAYFGSASAGTQITMNGPSGANLIWSVDGTSGSIGLAGANRPSGVYVKTTINLDSLSANQVVATDGSKNLVSSGISASGLGYLTDAEALTTFAMADNQVAAATIASWVAASFTSFHIHYSINRGAGSSESGMIVISSDGTTAGAAAYGAAVGIAGITFSADVSGGNVRLLYTSSNTGVAPTMKYKLLKWLA